MLERALKRYRLGVVGWRGIASVVTGEVRKVHVVAIASLLMVTHRKVKLKKLV